MRDPSHATLDTSGLSGNDAILAGLLEKLNGFLCENQEFGRDITEGIIKEAHLPSRQNALASPLKAAHNMMSYLMWLMDEVASGDYNQRLNVSSDLSKSFNNMVEYLLDLSMHDKITGILNWDGFKKYAASLISEKDGNNDTGYYILSFSIKDIDHYAVIYNSNERDALLKRVASFCTGICRRGEICARHHDDNFLCLLMASSAEEAARRMALCQKCSVFGSDTVVPIFRIGIYPVHSNVNIDITGMCNRAAFAQYSSSQYGDGYAVFNDDMAKKYDWQNNIMSRFKYAIQNHEFQPYYQPKVCTSTGKVASCEALARWFRSDGSMVMPGDFIEIFEKNGAITMLDFYMLEEICRQIAERRAAGLNTVPVAINFSRENLLDESFVSNISYVMKKYDFPASMLEVEITETAFFERIDIMLNIVDQLHQAGFMVSMDDFGSGFSSLNMLKNIPVDTLKIDRLFFKDFGTDERVQLLLRDILFMSKHMGLKTVAEGVEHADEVDFLRKNECDFIQGYYFYKPMPQSDFYQLIDGQ